MPAPPIFVTVLQRLSPNALSAAQALDQPAGRYGWAPRAD